MSRVEGGDDLGNDDEYLDDKWLSQVIFSSGKIDELKEKTGNHTKKRKKIQENGPVIAGDYDDDSLNNRRIRSSLNTQKSRNQLLLESGRDIVSQSSDIQAAFMSTCFTHWLKLSEDTHMLSSGQFRKFSATDFFCSSENSFAARIKSRVSVKRLKKWKNYQSPLVLIACSSARRAMTVLKDIESIHVRIAKLFSKHISIDDQVSSLKSNYYSIAVGTPNRILRLFETSNESATDSSGKNEHRALSLAHTELFIMDAWEDSKRFTVCTMNDTAPDLMKLINAAVIPQMKERRNIKLAFF